jgi:hypothetical protein
MVLGQFVFWTLVALVFGCPLLAQSKRVDSVMAYSCSVVALLVLGLIGATL